MTGNSIRDTLSNEVFDMKFQELEKFFYEYGYNKIPSNLPEFTFFFRAERAFVNVFHVVDYRSELYISEDQYSHLKETIIAFFKEKHVAEVHILSLLICTDVPKAKQLCGNDPFCWIIDPLGNRLIVHETQTADFYGMRGQLEDFLYKIAVGAYKEHDTAEQNITVGRRKYTQIWSAYITFLLVVCNVVLFIICTFTGEVVYNIGAFSVMNLIGEGGWYRLVSAMFLHWDIGHLVSNMLILYYIGSVVERKMGHLSYLVLYLMSGLAGNILSAGYELYTSEFMISAGASGAIFGIEGALIVLVLLSRGEIEHMTLGRVVFALAFSLYCGFTDNNINNAAHLGGVMMGFVLAAFIWFFKKGNIRKE